MAFALYVAIAMFMGASSRLAYGSTVIPILANAGLRPSLEPGPLSFLGSAIYFLCVVGFLVSLLHPLIVSLLGRLVRIIGRGLIPTGQGVSAAAYSGLLFFLLLLPIWLGTPESDFLGFVHLLFFTVMLTGIESLWGVTVGSGQTDSRLTPQSRIELLKFEHEKWWRTLQLVWPLAVAFALTVMIGWALGRPPEGLTEPDSYVYREATIRIATIELAVAAVGAGFVLAYFVIRSEHIQQLMRETFATVKPD